MAKKKQSYLRGWLGRQGSIKRSQMLFILTIFVPLISLFIIIRIIPIAATLGTSFTNMHLIRPVTKFVGMKNFVRLLEDKQFISAFFNSIEYVVVAVPLEIGRDFSMP